MISFIKRKSSLIKDLALSFLTIFIVSTLIAILYNFFWSCAYIIGNILILIFLRWLYQDSWNTA